MAIISSSCLNRSRSALCGKGQSIRNETEGDSGQDDTAKLHGEGTVLILYFFTATTCPCQSPMYTTLSVPGEGREVCVRLMCEGTDVVGDGADEGPGGEG